MAFPPSRTLPRAQNRRVVVTGMGIQTSMGLGVEDNAEGFRAGRSALRKVSLFDTSRQRVGTAGEIAMPDTLPPHSLTAREVERLDRASRMLLHAGAEALDQCGWNQAAEPSNVPLCFGTSAGAMEVGEAYYRQAVGTPNNLRGQAERVHLYQTQCQILTFCKAFTLCGPISIITNACASGANAIGHAFQLIKSGAADRAIAGGYDALCQLVFAGFDSLQALSTSIPRPFDANRDGLALGEGAAVMILETLESAQARSARILAEVVGYGAVTDRHHLTQPHPEGDAALASMTMACREAGVAPREIDYINSHGTGTPLNDVAEGNAIRRWAGEDVAGVKVSSTKALIGHLLGGAGAVEAAICIMAMRGGWIPPSVNVREKDPVCTFDLVTEPREARLNHVLTNSFGFGGANATLVMRRAPGE